MPLARRHQPRARRPEWPAAASRADSVASHVGSACADLNADSASRVSREQRSQALPGKCSFTTSCQTLTGIR